MCVQEDAGAAGRNMRSGLEGNQHQSAPPNEWRAPASTAGDHMSEGSISAMLSVGRGYTMRAPLTPASAGAPGMMPPQ